MVKKLKAMANKSRGDNQLAGAVKESAQEIWLAGLGAFAKAQEEGQKVFKALVREGSSMQQRTMKATEDKVRRHRPRERRHEQGHAGCGRAAETSNGHVGQAGRRV